MTYEQTCEDCLKEMFRRVGEEYPNEELTSQDEWYHLRTWTEEAKQDFEKWMTALIKKRHKLPMEKVYAEVAFFLLMWGWKTDDSKPRT